MKLQFANIIKVILFGLGSLAAIMAIKSFQQDAAASQPYPPPENTDDPYPSPTTYGGKTLINPYIDEIESFQQELENESLPDDTRYLLTEKLKTVSLMATQRAEGLLNPLPRSPLSTPHPIKAINVITLPDGIDNTPEIVDSPEATFINSWRKSTPERLYLIYAGSLLDDPKQGAIMIFDPSRHDFKHYITPKRKGSVKVVEERDNIIVLQVIKDAKEKNAFFFFDFVQEVFVGADGNIIPIPKPSRKQPTPSDNLAYP